ncbi:TolC family protein [Brucella pituitosa]|uniref:TolC family protein n=1 Tax=Brucella pituitosa TaxID=571256 RepID=A0ABS3K7D6_9HYPH|nr:TolC family protein [Brucella pituitosa]MBO1042290.1 TolC family protein [Brucella pituitosa]
MHIKRLAHRLVGASLLFLTACQNISVPDVEAVKHQLNVPADWQSTSNELPYVGYPPSRWWLTFHDEQLNCLVDTVLDNNQDLAAAVFRLREAELNQQFVGTNLAPDITAGFSARSSKQLNHSTPSMRSYSSSFSLNYEVDLWGKLAATRDVAAWEASATAFDLDSSRLKLIGSALELYWRHAWYAERLRLLEDEHNRLDYLLKLAQLRYRVGSGTQLEALQAQQEMDNQENDRQRLLNQQQENLRTLSALLAQPPGRALPFRLRDALTDDIEMVKAPLPVALLARRPDLRAAEYRLRNRLANVEITRKSFYPTLSLSSSVDAGANRDLAKILSDPVGSVGGSLMLSFLQFREMALKTDISEMQYRQAAAEFSQTFYTVLKEVENILTQRVFYYQESLRLERAAQTASKAWTSSKAAWKAGLLSLKDVLDQQQTFLNIQQQQAENRLNRHLSEMRFYLATGGW